MTESKPENGSLLWEASEPGLEQRLNGETGRIAWPELARYFARGVLLLLDKEEDLVAVAATMVRDDSAAIETLMKKNRLRVVDMDDAVRWQEQQETPLFWAVVAAPWVLIQLTD